MRRCPSCGAACGDEDMFCESDGTALGAAPSPQSPKSVNAAGSGVCEACGATGSDDGDGYCSVCGHRLAPAPARAANAIEKGTRIGRYVVQSGGEGEAIAFADGAGGGEVLLVLEGHEALGHEADALARLASHPGLPRVVEHGASAPGVLALTSPSTATRRLADVLQNAAVERTVAALRGLLEIVAAVEAAGFSFAPQPRDLLLAPNDAVVLSRLRGASPLRRGAGADARHLLESLGDIFLAPAIMGPTALVKLLAPNRDAPSRSVAAAQAAVAAIEADLAKPRAGGPLAELCDAGLWRPYNQDATAIDQGRTPSGDPFVVMVVCDGVSSSAYSDRASRVAARSARDALGHFARSPDVDHDSAASAVGTAIRAAHLAVCAAHVADPVQEPPGTTIAAAFICKRRLTVGWVGDSRAYWLTQRGAELLTHDHSWVNEAIARGEVKDPDEVQGALAHTITRCLGPLEVGDVPAEIEPDVRTRDLAGPGLVVLCSDGLWNYAPKASDLAAVIRGVSDEKDAEEVARLLINYALARGGHDNVSVGVYAHT